MKFLEHNYCAYKNTKNNTPTVAMFDSSLHH